MSPAREPPPALALVAGTISDGRGGPSKPNATIVIIDGRIAAITIAVASDDLVPSPSSTTSHVMGSVFLSGVEGLVEEGMTPSQALVAATWNGALAAGRESQIGSISVGKRADLVVLEADPLKDIHNIRRVVFVVLRGHVVNTY
jgi:imidazolonepropionase-like amidohydrolase